MASPTPSFSREETPFTSHGTKCAAWWYQPTHTDDERPVIVMAHGFAGVRALRLDAYAERFAAAGYAVLLFDYRSFGDSDGDPRQVLDLRRQLQDWSAAVEHARALPGTAPDRVVLWGTSLSGGHVLNRAGRDHRVAAVVAQVPHVSGVAAALAVGPVMSLRLTWEALRDLVTVVRRRRPHYLLAIGNPGELAAMTSPDARPGLDRMLEQSSIAEPTEAVAARVILQMALYSPGLLTWRIQAPTLVQIGLKDAITPTCVAARAARRIPRGEILEYDLGHFDPYVEPHFDTVVRDQLAFLTRVVPPALR